MDWELFMEMVSYSLLSPALHDVIGLFGVLLYIGSYSALQLGRLDGNSLKYSFLNGLAATLVLVSLFKDFNLASALIQIVWITVSIGGIYRHITTPPVLVECRKPVQSSNQIISAGEYKK